MTSTFWSRLPRVWLVTAIVDGLFASTLNAVAYDSTVSALWRGVASTVLGPGAMSGGMQAALVGILLHFAVALAWSSVFLWLLLASHPLQRAVATPQGVLAVAIVYGLLVWMVMSFVVIPLLTGRAPTLTGRWWVQMVGHMFFVGLPIVAVSASLGAPQRPPPARADG